MYSVFLSQFLNLSDTVQYFDRNKISGCSNTHSHTPIMHSQTQTLTHHHTNLHNYDSKQSSHSQTHILCGYTHTRAQKHQRVPFLRPFVCVSQCVSCLCCSAVLYCLFSSFWVSGAPCWSVLPLLSCLLVTIQRSAERNCSSHVYSTQLFHNDRLAPSLPDSLLLLSVFLFLSLTLSPQCTHHLTSFYLHLSLLDIAFIHSSCFPSLCTH